MALDGETEILGSTITEECSKTKPRQKRGKEHIIQYFI